MGVCICGAGADSSVPVILGHDMVANDALFSMNIYIFDNHRQVTSIYQRHRRGAYVILSKSM